MSRMCKYNICNKKYINFFGNMTDLIIFAVLTCDK